MSQAAVILEPVTYSRKRRSLAKALSQAGLAEEPAPEAEEAVTPPPYRDLVDMEAGTTGVFEAIQADGRIRTASRKTTTRTDTTLRTDTTVRTETRGRRASTWMPAGYTPEHLDLLSDPQTASDLPWLKAKRKGKFLRRLKAFSAWMATLIFIGAVLAGTAYVMGLFPLAEGLAGMIAQR